MSAVNPLPSAMSVAEFLAWEPPDLSDRWELVDGTPRAMSPTRPRHGALLSEVSRLISNHLVESRPSCRVIIEPGIQPKVRGKFNGRVPDLAVTCVRLEPEDRLLRKPVVAIEILSPSNEAETWQNVWSYVTIPSVQEILVLHSSDWRSRSWRRSLPRSRRPGPTLRTSSQPPNVVVVGASRCPITCRTARWSIAPPDAPAHAAGVCCARSART